MTNPKQVLSRFIKSDIGLALIIALSWKIVMLTLGYILDLGINGGGQSLLHHTRMWDSNWYTLIINDQYATNPYSAAFYPMFPLLVGLLHAISFGTLDILVAGQIINTVAVWLLMLALIKLAREFLGNDKKLWIIGLVLAMPAAFFLHVFYSEAIFMTLGVWAYLFALKRRWLAMGIILALITATRLPGLLFVGLCGLEFMRAYDWNLRKIFNKKLLYFLLAPIGFIGYGIYLQIVRGDFLAMFHAYGKGSDWTYQIFDPNVFYTIAKSAYQIPRWLMGERPYGIDIVVNVILPIAAIVILGTCSVYLIAKHRKKALPLGIFGLISIVMFTLNSNVISVHRYILPCLTVYIAIALYIRGKHQFASLLGIMLAGIVIQLMLFAFFIGDIFAG